MEQQSQERWRLVFLSAAVINLATALFYVVFASGEPQPWNQPRAETDNATRDTRLRDLAEPPAATETPLKHQAND